jgi:hypothetical protein
MRDDSERTGLKLTEILGEGAEFTNGRKGCKGECRSDWRPRYAGSVKKQTYLR